MLRKIVGWFLLRWGHIYYCTWLVECAEHGEVMVAGLHGCNLEAMKHLKTVNCHVCDGDCVVRLKSITMSRKRYTGLDYVCPRGAHSTGPEPDDFGEDMEIGL